MTIVGYCVTAIHGKRTAWLLGPYDTHEQALTNVERGSRLANDTAFAAYGTCKLTSNQPQRTAFGV